MIKYYLREYFGLDVRMKIIDLAFEILSIWFDSSMPSSIIKSAQN